jgi:hypothetical protein
MRNLILLPVFLLTVCIIFSSCKKDHPYDRAGSEASETMHVKIAPNQSYQLDFSSANLTISRQANHFLLSETSLNIENGGLVYKYIPAKDFTGNDEVIFLSTQFQTNNITGSSSGCQSNSNVSSSSRVKYITLQITVDN